MRSNQTETKEIESALRVINRYSDSDDERWLQKALEPKAPKITDAILEAITESGKAGVTSAGIKQYLKDQHGIEVKPSTLSVMIQRHKEKRNIAKDGNKWFPASH